MSVKLFVHTVVYIFIHFRAYQKTEKAEKQKYESI